MAKKGEGKAKSGKAPDKGGKAAQKSARGKRDREASAEQPGKKEAAATTEVDEKTGPPRLKVRFREEILGALTKEFEYENPMRVPRLQKVVVNMGLGEAVGNPNIVKTAVEELTQITGQRAVITRARKSISNFKLRAGVPIGAMVTLRGDRMWEFLDRLLNVAVPRIRDFKGLSSKAFDGRGNYTMGVREQIIFPEINYDKVDKIKGLNITIASTAKNDKEGKALLKHLGVPFRN